MAETNMQAKAARDRTQREHTTKRQNLSSLQLARAVAESAAAANGILPTKYEASFVEERVGSLCPFSASAALVDLSQKTDVRHVPASPGRGASRCAGSPRTRPALECIDRSDGSDGGVAPLLSAARGLRRRLSACN